MCVCVCVCVWARVCIVFKQFFVNIIVKRAIFRLFAHNYYLVLSITI